MRSPTHGFKSLDAGAPPWAKERDAEPPDKEPLVDIPPSKPFGAVQVMPRPYGLPKWIRLEDYVANPVCYLSTHNYKIQASVGSQVDSLTTRLSVLDTGAVPNLVRLDVLSPADRKKISTTRECVNLSSATNHRLHTVGTISLCVKVATQTARQTFIVVRQLGADVILGCTFIDRHV